MASTSINHPPKLDAELRGSLGKIDSVHQIKGCESWNPAELADYFEKEGLGEYREVIIHHKIVSIICCWLHESVDFQFL